MTTLDQVPLHFQAIGRITSQWEVCELYLADIYQILCESANDAPFRCYGALISASIRFELLEIAATGYFRRPGQLRDKLTRCIQTAKEMNSKRNKVAHSHLMTTIKRRSIQMQQIPLWHQTRRYKEGLPKYTLTFEEANVIASDMVGFAITLKHLISELDAFDKKRRGRRARQFQARFRKGQTHAQ